MADTLTYHLHKTRAIIDNSIGLIATLIISLAVGFSLIADFSQTTVIIALIIAPLMLLQWRLLYYGIKRIFAPSALLTIDASQLIDSTRLNGKKLAVNLSDISSVTLFYSKGPKLKLILSNFDRYNDQLSLFDLFIRKLNPNLRKSVVISLKYVREHPDDVLEEFTEFMKIEKRKKPIHRL